MKKTTKSMDRAIDAVPRAVYKACGICATPDLARVVARWLQRRAAGDPVPPLAAMVRHLFSKVAPCSETGVRRHCAACLGVDHTTGKKL